MVTLAVSDIHLGYSESNVDAFNAFLRETIKRNDVEAFVILGDCIDMWRRDVSGLFLENHQTTELILALKQKTDFHYVVGNHDYHLQDLVDHKYPFQFEKNLTLPKKDVTYVFKHGWEFDDEQSVPVMELLCDNLSDEGGQIRSDIWTWITARAKDLKSIEQVIKKNSEKGFFFFHKNTERIQYFQRLLTPPKDRLSTAFSGVEKKAAASVEEGQLLIFGHTHRPFVSPSQNLVNTGSWVSDEKTFNTWVELDGKNIRLMQFGVGDITAQFTKMI